MLLNTQQLGLVYNKMPHSIRNGAFTLIFINYYRTSA